MPLLREIETIRNVIKDEMPLAIRGKDLEQMLERYNDQMQVAVSTALSKQNSQINQMDYQEAVQETEAIARQAREIAQHQYLSEIRAKYQQTTE